MQVYSWFLLRLNILGYPYSLREKCPDSEFFSGPFFPAFEVIAKIYSVILRILLLCNSPNAGKNKPE